MTGTELDQNRRISKLESDLHLLKNRVDLLRHQIEQQRHLDDTRAAELANRVEQYRQLGDIRIKNIETLLGDLETGQ